MESTDNSPIQPAAPVIMQMTPIDKIKSSPYQARKSFPEESILELSQNIKSVGLIQPLTLRPLPDGTYELIGGERRLRAVKRLGWTTVKAQILPDVDDQKAAELGLIENLQRVDLNAIERAQGYKKLADMGLTQDQIAQKVGLKDKSSIANTLTLLNLPQEVQEMFSRENLSEGQFRYLNRITDQTKLIEFAKRAAKEGWSVKETEKRVNQLVDPKKGGGKDQKEAKETPPDPLADFWPKLQADPSIVTPLKWGVSHNPHQAITNASGKTVNLPAWTFWIRETELTPKTALKNWFQCLAEAIGDTSEEADSFKKAYEAMRQEESGEPPAQAPIPAEPPKPVPVAAVPPPAPETKPPIDEERARRLAAVKAKYGRIL